MSDKDFKLDKAEIEELIDDLDLLVDIASKTEISMVGYLLLINSAARIRQILEEKLEGKK